MSHNIDRTVNAEGAAYFADKPAWHRLGRVVEGARTSSEVIELAGLDWEVEKAPLQALVTEPILGPDGIDDYEQPIPVEGHYATIRRDTNATLGIVGSQYRLLQNRDAFDFMDELVGTGEVRYESAGSLREGRVIWMLARLSTDVEEVIPGDRILPYLLLTNSHDGSAAIRVAGTSVRVVCNNTLDLAVAQKVRHTSNLDDKIQAIRETIGLVTDGYRAFIRDARELAKVDLRGKERRAEVADFMRDAFGIAKDEEMSAVATNRIETLITNWLADEKNAVSGMRGSAWGLINAVTQYVDHQWGTNDERRLHGAFIDRADFKRKAYEGVKQLAGIA